MEHLWLFALFVFGIIVIPGMDMAFVLSSALVDGKRGGFAAVGGLVAGGAVHTAMGALGVGVLLQVPLVFRAVLLAGALYVAWMGWGLWRSPAVMAEVGEAPRRPAPQTFARAMVTCLLNPKAYLFMLAVFPQFVRPQAGPVLPQILAMAAIIAATQAVVYGAVAVGASGVRAGLRESASAQVAVGRGVALLLIGTAAWALWQGLR